MTAPQDSSLAVLLASVSNWEFEEFGSSVVRAVHRTVETAEILIDVYCGGQNDSQQTWSIIGDEPVDVTVEVGPAELIDYHTNHTVLRPYLEETGQLSFLGAPSNPHAAVGELLAADHAWSSGWIPLGRFLRVSFPIAQLLAGGQGVLATGPRSLLECYDAVLQKYAVRSSILTLPPASVAKRFWRGDFLPLTFRPVALTIGKQYLAARNLRAIRQG
jgi:hypothetical protein